MEFSESFEFGNSTYKEIERQAADAVNDSTQFNDSAQPLAKCKELDVIPESPPLKGKVDCTSSYNHSRLSRLQGSSSKSQAGKTISRIGDRCKFSRSKSDTALSTDASTNNGYSAFFRSDLSFSGSNCQTSQLSTPANVAELNMNCVHDTYLNVSQIEAAIKDVETEDKSAIVKSTMDTNSKADYKTEIDLLVSNDVQSSVLTRLSDKSNLVPQIYEDINDLHDLSSFMYLPADNELLRKEIMKKELDKSRTFIKEHHLNDDNLDLGYCSSKDLLKSIPTTLITSLDARLNSSLDLNISTSSSSPSKSSSRLQCSLSGNLENLKNLSNWNLPEGVLKEYKRKGVQQMFTWQVECLAQEKILFEQKNLVYSAPTSAGKTLVSELLLLKTVLERQKKALLILPFISVVREKMLYLQDLFLSTGYRVEGFFGGYTPAGGFNTTNLAICTIEKANSIINKLMEQGKLDELGIVVVDEIHLISDPGRGYILELLLAKILYISDKYNLNIQIVTMSATLSNVQLLQQWLNAELYITDFRPVALKEMIKIGHKIYDNKMQLIRYINQPSAAVIQEAFPDIAKDADHVAQLCAETILEGCSVIIFCPSKDWCESLSMQLSEVFHTLIRRGGNWGDSLRSHLIKQVIDEVKGQLKILPAGLDTVLEKTITYGIAFHHAGLTTEERDVIEAAFKSGALKVIVATSTLSSGVNLPARRVLIRSPMFGGKPMNSLTYRQMIGRAGRTGKDTLGESILICSETNARYGKDIVTADLKPINSCLEYDSNTHLKRALLEVISAGVANTKKELDKFLNCTLLYAQKQYNHNNKETNIENDETDLDANALDFLIEYEFIRLHKNVEEGNKEGEDEVEVEVKEECYVATRLGMACLSASIPPTDGLMLLAELQKSRRCFVLESELHAVYLVTPYSVCFQLQDLDWLVFLDLWEKLSPAMRKVAEFVGVKESFIVRGMRGQTKLDFKLTQIHKRFYTALALQELVNEIPINNVANKYKCPRGLLQSLQQTSATFAGIVTCFCNALQWNTLSLIVGQFKERLYFGISRDLIDLMRLADLNHKRARILFNAGITTLTELANADVLQIESILYNDTSFDSRKQYDEESKHEAAERHKARISLITGKSDVTIAEAAKILIQQARQYVQYEIGVASINWSQGSKVEGVLHNATTNRSSLNISEEVMEADKTILSTERNDLKEEIEENVESDDKSKEFKKSEGTQKPKQPPINTVFSPRKTKTKNTPEKRSKTDDRIELKEEIKTNIVCDEKSKEFKKSEGTQKPKHLPINTSVSPRKTKMKNTPEKRSKNADRIELKEQIKEDIENGNKSEELKKPEGTLKPYQNSNSATATLTKLRKSCTPKKTFKTNDTIQLYHKETPQSEQLTNNAIVTSPKLRKNCTFGNHSKSSNVNCSTIKSSTGLLKSLELEKNLSTNKNNFQNKENPILGSSLVNPMPLKNGLTNCTTNTGNLEETFSKVNDLSSFTLNSQITEALKNAEQALDQDKLESYDNLQYEAGLESEKEETKDQLKLSQLQETNLQTSTTAEGIAIETSHCVSSNMEISDMLEGNSLMRNPMQLNNSYILKCPTDNIDPLTKGFHSIEIVDICANEVLFEASFKELKKAKRLAMSLAIDKQKVKRQQIIGGNLLNLNGRVSANGQIDNKFNEAIDDVDFPIGDCNYLDGIAFCLTDTTTVFYLNMQTNANKIATYYKCIKLKELFESLEYTLLIFDAKEQLKVLINILRSELKETIKIQAALQDPKIANWLLRPDKMYSLNKLVDQYAPQCKSLLQLCESDRIYNSIGLEASSSVTARFRSSIEACATFQVLEAQIVKLQKINNGQLYKYYQELEMPLQLSLSYMELYGFPIDSEALYELSHQLLETMKKLENEIYDLHGARFNLNSASTVGKILGIQRKSDGSLSTSKQILERIDSPLAQKIVNYRKINSILSKTIQPLLRCIQNERIHGVSLTFTSTGRISMTEPNLQNVAKDFAIDLLRESKSVISCRSVFSPPAKCKRSLLSSDFCQLEMRILAHLSQDAILQQVMSSDMDIFTAIASRWNKIQMVDVTEQMRNNTKQICYGIIYGVGIRTLAENLKCTEAEALLVSEQFHTAYPGIRLYADKVIKFARNKGYVETITGRRRYLEHINSEDASKRKHSERQAINTAIQGSAADIAKTAILRMEKNLVKYQKKLGVLPDTINLILHVHDELIYEVPDEKVKRIAKILRLTMENCVKLHVPLKVKLKIGKSWGQMNEIDL